MRAPPTETVASAYGRPLLQLAREIGRHLATMHRWRTRGVLDANGERRRLRMTRVGGRWHVKDDDCAAFFAALAPCDGPDAVPLKASASTHRKEAERAGRELDALGICSNEKTPRRP